jgi:hypothetical protein
LLLDLWEGTGRGVDCVESTSGQAAGRYAVIAWMVRTCVESVRVPSFLRDLLAKGVFGF